MGQKRRLVYLMCSSQKLNALLPEIANHPLLTLVYTLENTLVLLCVISKA